jgi:hypothetical protein
MIILIISLNRNHYFIGRNNCLFSSSWTNQKHERHDLKTSQTNSLQRLSTVRLSLSGLYSNSLHIVTFTFSIPKVTKNSNVDHKAIIFTNSVDSIYWIVLLHCVKQHLNYIFYDVLFLLYRSNDIRLFNI